MRLDYAGPQSHVSRACTRHAPPPGPNARACPRKPGNCAWLKGQAGQMATKTTKTTRSAKAATNKSNVASASTSETRDSIAIRLQRGRNGASLAVILEASVWQELCGGALRCATVAKQMGLPLGRTREYGGTRYHI